MPATNGTAADDVRLDALDTWGVWRRADAMAACTSDGAAGACALVDGGGAAETAMGVWLADGTPVEPALALDPPVPSASSDTHTFPITRRDAFPCDSGR